MRRRFVDTIYRPSGSPSFVRVRRSKDQIEFLPPPQPNQRSHCRHRSAFMFDLIPLISIIESFPHQNSPRFYLFSVCDPSSICFSSRTIFCLLPRRTSHLISFSVVCDVEGKRSKARKREKLNLALLPASLNDYWQRTFGHVFIDFRPFVEARKVELRLISSSAPGTNCSLINLIGNVYTSIATLFRVGFKGVHHQLLGGHSTFHFRSVITSFPTSSSYLFTRRLFLLPNPALTDDDNPLRLRENLFVSVNSPEREKTFLPKD